MRTLPLSVGVMGCGNVSDTYFRNAVHFADSFRIIACADVNPAAANERADRWNVQACLPEQLFAADIDVVLNLTVPTAHAEVSAAALSAGKHVYSEKPLAVSREQLDRLTTLANERSLQIACAPDTILGAAVQAARAAIQDGRIGDVVGATATFMSRGMEDWHPNPDFFFQPGGGPILDMGPYYIATLLELMGPLEGVSALASSGLKERRIGSGTRSGELIEIALPTSVRALLRFVSGADASFVASWDVCGHSLPHVEIYGTQGTLTLPDPNWFGGAVIQTNPDGSKQSLDLASFKYGTPNRAMLNDAKVADYRGLGLADLCDSIVEQRLPRLGLPFAADLTEALLLLSESTDGTFRDGMRSQSSSS